MSCLDVPRIHFNGIFFTNVCTTNNDDLTNVAAEFKPVVDPVTVTVNKNILAMSDAQAREWFEDLTPDGNNLNGGWNHYGNHLIGFQDAVVSEIVTAPGASPSAASGLVGAAVSLPGHPKMVDVDPTGSANTQLFLGGFQLGDATLGLTFSPSPGAISYFRWLGRRNISVPGFTAAAATWQFAMAYKNLEFNGDDPDLKLLKTAAKAGKGLLVQFCTYFLRPDHGAQQLHQMFKAGKKTQNPARGQMVGTVGVWNDDDLATFPNGRQLVASKAGQKAVIGAAAAKVHADKGIVSLNLITAIPEKTAQTVAAGTATMRTMAEPASPALQKVSFGRLDLGYRPAAGGAVVTLGEVAGYDDYATYRRRAGIVDVAFDASLAKDVAAGDLVLVSSGSGILAEEQPLVIESDDHSAYLSANDPNKTIAMVVRLRGEPFTGAVDIATEIQKSTYSFNPFTPPQNAVSAEFAGATDAGGKVRVPVEAGAMTATLKSGGKGAVLRFWLQASDPASGLKAPPMTVGVRIYQDEDFSNPPAAKRSWQEIYDTVLRYYNLVFPAMSDILDLSDQQTVIKNAATIMANIQLPFESPLYMPVTRSMSPARRKLLIDWLDAHKNDLVA